MWQKTWNKIQIEILELKDLMTELKDSESFNSRLDQAEIGNLEDRLFDIMQ